MEVNLDLLQEVGRFYLPFYVSTSKSIQESSRSSISITVLDIISLFQACIGTGS